MTREEKMHHPPIDELALFAGGDCGVFEKWRISRHVSACRDCRSEIEAFRAAEATLREKTAEFGLSPETLQQSR